MSTFFIAVGAFFGFYIAYHTYGRWLARKIFALDAEANVPSKQLCDDVDFVPSSKSLVFGHHFTSIAGTGPIVGPAIAVFWGWLPALLWVIFGSIFIGAVHDFSALVVSLRNRGQTVGEVAGRIISPRAKVLFLLVLFFALTIVLAIFGLVIASIFKFYPESVLPVWDVATDRDCDRAGRAKKTSRFVSAFDCRAGVDLSRRLCRSVSLTDRVEVVVSRWKRVGRVLQPDCGLDVHLVVVLRDRVSVTGLVVAATTRLH